MSSLENQYFIPTFDDSWLSQDNNSTFYNFYDDDPFSPLSDMVRPESTTSSTFTSPSISGSSDLDTPMQTRISAVRNKKITKRKCGAGRKSTTTFVNADASNFRQLVQQMTGVKFGVILKPEAQRVGNRFHGCLPTLDTSAYSFDHRQEYAPITAKGRQGYFSAEGGAGGLNNDCFPTLESWVGM
ncbi:calmodulin-binding protein 25-like [Apium graveolens]|uniref:calmodulin-binding protein 25-like n=1 Tax=Apium graveolens TaxID=4045 RepID=UPI003D7AC55A